MIFLIFVLLANVLGILRVIVVLFWMLLLLLLLGGGVASGAQDVPVISPVVDDLAVVNAFVDPSDPVGVVETVSPVCDALSSIGPPMSLACLNELGDADTSVDEVGLDSGPLINAVSVNIIKVVDTCPVVAVIDDSADLSPVLGGVENGGVVPFVEARGVFPVVEASCNPADGNVECVQVENVNGNLVSSNTLVDVPVTLVETQTMANRLGDISGLDIRNHLNWLNGSSDCEYESEFSECGLASPDFCGGSDPANDFTLVRARPVLTVASQGRFRGRGRRRR